MGFSIIANATTQNLEFSRKILVKNYNYCNDRRIFVLFSPVSPKLLQTNSISIQLLLCSFFVILLVKHELLPFYVKCDEIESYLAKPEMD
jgi:hypothetical protein